MNAQQTAPSATHSTRGISVGLNLRCPSFTGRTKQLAQIENILSQSSSASTSNRAVLVGMGGIGKSHIIRKYAEDHLRTDNRPKGYDAVAFIDRLLTHTPEPERLDLEAAKKEWHQWFDAYTKRIQGEHDQAAELGWSTDFEKMEEERQTAMKAVNPRFVLRQWLLEDVIKRVERDSDTGKRVLAKVLHVSSST